ncbi:hypothetical protein CLHUN_19200 [Ruminiclostridium hungatei]|uniref:Uncharacterized protein n=1 Tax=Ruminiclostridium hungatei TaxID=48256 RepID=A0A1V4SLL6_RUMHU|nr:hypothetical protein [Ruminiclostridium hungatei]OPX44121.1 hypothetical protein CLHUN_19200 [Ruminiclostridium hungatei]
MSYRRLTLIIAGQLALLFPVVFMALRLFQGNTDYLIAFMFFTIIFLYTVSFVIKEIKNVRIDKKSGIQSDIMIFHNQKLLYKSHKDNMPPIRLATFSYCDKEEYISLSGDYSNIKLIKGNHYKVKYYKNSGLLTDITLYKGRKIGKAISKVSGDRKVLGGPKTIFSLLVNLLLYGLPVFILFWGAYEFFKFLQNALLMSKKDILLIQPDFLKSTFIIFGFAAIMLVFLEKVEPISFGKLNDIYKKIGFHRSLSILLISFFIVLSIMFNTYVKISENGIVMHSIYSNKVYPLKSVDCIKTYPYSSTYRRKVTLKLQYTLFLEDGQAIELNKSRIFWDKVSRLNAAFSSQGVPIRKGCLAYPDSVDLFLSEDLDVERDMDKLKEVLIIEEIPLH